MNDWLEKLLQDMKSGASDSDLFKRYPQLQNDPGRLTKARGVGNIMGKGLSYNDAKDYYFDSFPEQKVQEPVISQPATLQNRILNDHIDQPHELKPSVIAPPITEQPQKTGTIDPNDPLGSAYNHILDRHQQINQRKQELNNLYNRSDIPRPVHPFDAGNELHQLNTEQNSLNNGYSYIQNTLKYGAPATTQEATDHLNEAVHQAHPNAPDVRTMTPTEIQNLLPKGNLTDQAMLTRYQNNHNVLYNLSNAQSVEQAALRWAKQNPQIIGEQTVKQLNQMAPTDEPTDVGGAQMGNIVNTFLEQPAAKEWAGANPQNSQVYNQAKNNLFANHQFKDYGVQQIASYLSQKKEDTGQNGILNINSPGELDQWADQALKSGEWTPAEYNFYKQHKLDILPQLKNSGMINRFGEGLEKGIGNLVGGVKDLATLKTFGLEDNSDVRDAANEANKQTQLKVNGFWKNFLGGGAESLGEMVPLMATTKALTGLGLGSKTANGLAMALSAEHPIAQQALQEFPDDPVKREGYKLLMLGVNGAFGTLVGREKQAEGLEALLKGKEGRAFTDEVVNTIDQFTEGKITQDAAKQMYEGTVKGFLNKAADYAGKSLSHNLVQTGQMAGLALVQDVADKVFGGREVSADDMGRDILESAKTAFLAGTPLSMLAAHADITKDSHIASSALWEMASDPDRYRTLIENLGAADRSVGADEKIKNLNTAVDLKRQMDSNSMLDGLTAEEKQKYLFQSLSQKVLEEQLKNTTDNVLKKKIKEQIKQSENFNERLITKEPLDIKEPSAKEKEDGVVPYYEDEKNVPKLADKIQQSQPLTDEDHQLYKNFSSQVEEQLQKRATKEQKAAISQENPFEPLNTENNAISESSAEKLPIPDAPSSSETLGGGNEEEPSINQEPAPAQEYKTSKGLTVSYDNGERVVRDSEGKTPSKKAIKEALDEHAQKYNYNQGTRADDKPMPEIHDPSEAKRWIVENSNNPSEVAQMYMGEEKQPVALSAKEQAIAGYGIGKIKESSYRQFGDRNNQNIGKARTYFSKNGESIDTVAKAIADHSGLDITPQDVVDYIDRFPSGGNVERMAETPVHEAAKERFKELTGIPLTEDIAIKAAIQGAPKALIEATDHAFASDSLPQEEVLKWLEEDSKKHFENDNEENNNLDYEPTTSREFSTASSEAGRDIPASARGTQGPNTSDDVLQGDAVPTAQSEGQSGGDGGPTGSQSENTEGGAKEIGISHDLRSERTTETGQEAPKRGEGISASDSIERGKELLEKGVDPHRVAHEFKQSGKISGDDIAVVRAHYNKLVKATEEAVQKYGAGSEQDKAAKEAEARWYNEVVKPMQTVWHEAGMAQQGTTDIDTGSFVSIRRNFEEQNGRPMTKAEQAKAQAMADEYARQTKEIEELNKKFIQKIDEEIKRRQTEEKKTYAQKAKTVANQFRKLKTKPFVFTDSNGNPVELTKMGVTWNDLVELGAKAIEKTGEIADGIAAVVEKVKDLDWYKNLSQPDKDRFARELSAHYKNAIQDTPEARNIKRLEKQLEDLRNGKIKNPADKRTPSEREQELLDQIFAEKEKLGLVKSRAAKPEGERHSVKETSEDQNVRRLEKQLEELRIGKVKNPADKRPPSEREKDLLDQIRNEKEKLGLVKSKMPSPEEVQAQKEQDTADLAATLSGRKGKEYTPQEAKRLWDYAKSEYVDKGVDFDTMITNTAMDLGIEPEDVRDAIVMPKAVRVISDAMYRKIDQRAKTKRMAEEWVKSSGKNPIFKVLKAVPDFFFGLKVFGHGTVGMVTHAGMNIFDPVEWKRYWPMFFKQFKLAYNVSYHAQAMADHVRDPQYTFWKRSGLAIDPGERYDDYQFVTKIFNKMGKVGEWLTAGDRGFDALKLYRLERAKALWAKTSNLEKADPNTAKMIASLVNHSTGTSKVPLPEKAGVLFFAPRLEASRWSRLVIDPAKAVGTFSHWNRATPAEKAQAMIVAKRAGRIMATYAGALLANQALLSLAGSKQSINFTNPTSSDWLKFKVDGHTLDMSGGMVSLVNFLTGLGTIASEAESDLPRGKSRKDMMVDKLWNYGSGKFSPFLSTVKDVVTHHDFQGNTLPFFSDKPKKGKEQLSFKEYFFGGMAPIPVTEGFTAYDKQMKVDGTPPSTARALTESVIIAAVVGGTGVHVGDEPQPKQESKGTDIRSLLP